MTKEQKQIAVILAGLSLIAISVGGRLFGKKAAPPAPAAGMQAATTGDAQAVKFELPPLAEDIVKKQRLGARRPWGRNPFAVASTAMPKMEEAPPVSSLAGLAISAIVLREGSGMAMVNDEIVRPGDTLRGYKVVKIDMSGIILEKEGEKVVIPYAK